jgi:histidinol-phosphate aminotransferase
MIIEELIRENIRNMHPYSSARHEYFGDAKIFLDANENPFPSEYHRYPHPLQLKLKESISRIKEVPVPNIFLGNGSDEAIDLLLRVFCEPGKDNAIICPPTYGMYEVCANVNAVRVNRVPLNEKFQLNTEAVLKACDAFTKLIFLCSPNNPTGNSLDRSDIETLLKNFRGIVVIDEAYIDYSRQHSYNSVLADYPNLVVLQTLSKAWGLAGLRLGMAFASPEIIGYLNKIKYPYNINTATQQLAIAALEAEQSIKTWTDQIVEQRKWLEEQLHTFQFVTNTYPSDANFLLVKFQHAQRVYEHLLTRSIVVRNRTNEPGCENCLRITVGTPEQNEKLINELKHYQ